MRLEVLICTFGADGISRLSRPDALPHIDGVGYLISWQTAGCDPCEIPDALRRSDVRVVTNQTLGLSNNRNNSLDNAVGEICLIADDDLVFNPDGLRAAIEKMESHRECGLALFKYDGPDDKYYPPTEYLIGRRLARRHFVTSFEIMFRLDAIRKSGVRFNPKFGVGNTDYSAGEESIWLHQLLQKDVVGRFFPIVIATHPTLTTGPANGAKPGVLKADGAYIAVAYKWTGVLRVLLLAWRRSRRYGRPYFAVLSDVAKGYLRATFRPKSLGIK